MRTNFRRFIIGGLTVVVAGVLVVGVMSCSSSSTSPSAITTSSQSTPVTTQTTSSTLVQPPTTSGSFSGRGGGANGTITQINGDALTLNTQQGSVTVTVGSNTSIQKIVASSISDLQTGQLLSVIGTKDSSGNITATSITARPQKSSSGFTPPNGGNFTPGGPNRVGSRSTAGGFGNGTFGTLSSIDGNTLTLTTMQGQQVTVTVASNTVILQYANGSVSDLQIGNSITVMGSRDTIGNINAVSITIRPQNTSTTGS